MIILLASLLPVFLHAQTISLQSISREDYDDIAREFAASSAFSSVAGAGALGLNFGFELGAIAGLTNAPDLHRVSRRANPSSDVSRLPTAGAFVAVTVPLGLTVEATGLPRVGSRDYAFESYGLGLKWTPTHIFFDLPLDLALRAQATKTSVKFTSRTDDVITTANFDGATTGFELVVSKNLGILTPFVAVGGATARADMTAASAAVFDPSFGNDQTASAKTTGGLYRAGLEIHLLILTLAAEYEHILGADRFDAKLTAGF